ncbi:MAG: Ppx/GppA family phosphatase [Alphaproteobacteria bacterium]|nr:Ppx/GppA family phosphatase [Alphaproteobacteria bacterium]
MPTAAIDLGSNSALLLVVDDAGTVIADEATVVGLGRGLGDGGTFAPDRAAAALDTLATYAATALRLGVPPDQVRAVATSASRRARDAPAFFARVTERTGLRFRIVSGDEEAALTFAGALQGSPWAVGDAPVVVVDPGGGSTEVVAGRGLERGTGGSMEVGTVRLTEAFLGTDVHDAAGVAPLVAAVRAELARLPPLPRPDVVIGVAGTVTTLATVRLGLPVWDADRVHGSLLERTWLRQTAQRLLPLDPAARRAAVPAAPQRADYLAAGALLLDEVLAHLDADALVVSVRGLRWALVGEVLPARPPRG